MENETEQCMLWRDDHIAENICINPHSDMERRSRPMVNNAAWELGAEKYPEVMRRLERAGFLGVFKMGHIMHIPDILEALIERWRPERNCFDLPSGEKTITLEDVAYITDLPIDGDAVSNVTSSLDVFNWCHIALPAVPPDAKPEVYGNTVTFSWLKGAMTNYLRNVPGGPTDDMYDRYTRGLILLLITGVLMPHTRSSKVHLMFLPLLMDFDQTSRYSWGAATLAWLYRALYKSTDKTVSQFSVCGHILYAWFWLRYPSLAPVRRQPLPPELLFPLGARY